VFSERRSQVLSNGINSPTFFSVFTSIVYPLRTCKYFSSLCCCRQAQNADELTIVENEQLEVVGEGDGEGWVLARNYRGEEGFIPKNYVEAEGVEEGEEGGGGGGSSFSSVDYTVDDRPATTTTAPPAVVKDGNANDMTSYATNGAMINHVTVAQDEGDYCCAVYDYEATCKEELSFIEGAVIKVLRRQVHDVDDGWWEGEVDGQVGLFPSIVVEECRPNGEPYVS
jgi:hypothetical protein